MKFTARQEEAQALLAGDATHLMLFGGSRSGKTFLFVRTICIRAFKAAGSRHAILRFRFNHLKASIVYDTFPKVMEICFPEVPYHIDKTDWFVEFPNGSTIWFGGLDDKERTEKILGQEYCVDPASRVLTADLRWVRADSLIAGDVLIGFPEAQDGHLKLVPSIVQRSETIIAEKCRVLTDKGSTTVSVEHQFVVHYDDRRHKNYRQFSWCRASSLKPGDVLRWTCEPWDIGESQEDGWFSGMLDGEGWVSKAARMAGVAQCAGICLNALRAWLACNRVPYADRIGTGKFGSKGPCHKLTASGLWASLRMLGIARPKRLDASLLWDGCRAFRNPGHYATVLDIERVGAGPVVSISTSTKTFISDGFLSHNCSVFLNECSQIPFASRNIALTRLAQMVTQRVGGVGESPLKPRMYYDCVAGDTLIGGTDKTAAELAAVGQSVEVLTTHGMRRASAPWKNGFGAMLRVTAGARSVVVTPSHRFWVAGKGWMRADAITIGQRLLCSEPSRFPHGASSDPHETEIAADLLRSCYRYLRRRDAPLQRTVAADQPHPAFASDVIAHSRLLVRRVLSGFHMARHELREALRSRRSREFHGPLWQSCEILIFDMGRAAARAACEWSQRILLSALRWLEAGYLALPTRERFVVAPLLIGSLSYLERVRVSDAIDRQSPRCNGSRSRSLDRTAAGSTRPLEELNLPFSLDMPVESAGLFVTADCIVLQPAQDYYTIEVPGCQHYSANGFVSHNCNPPAKNHWCYRMFVAKEDYETGRPLYQPDDYAAMQINPSDNLENLPPSYLQTLASLPARYRKRFLEGEFGEANPNALWTEAVIERWRVMSSEIAPMQRIAVGVDPSGSGDVDNADHDEIGIVVCGVGQDGIGYVLEDVSLKAGPARWGAVVASAFERHAADVVAAEVNFGGAMVEHVIKTARAERVNPRGTGLIDLRMPFKSVTASRGKTVRAEPISALFETGKVRMVGEFRELEQELVSFSTNGYLGEGSPNRADAMVWALYELFPGLIRRDPKKLQQPAYSLT